MHLDSYRNKKLEDSPIITNTSPSNVVSVMKKLLNRSIYENADFSVNKNSVSINLKYDPKPVADTYIKKIKEMFPDCSVIKGTRVQIKNKKGDTNAKRNKSNIKTDRRAGESGKSSSGNAPDIIR